MRASATVGGRYALAERLGEGGMGQVYRARHVHLGKSFALKLIAPTFALDHVARERFTQEARLASEISHPNLVPVVDFGEDDTYGAYMVMELVEGEPLIRAGAPAMEVRRACDVLAQIADALDHIHGRGIVHGDVKADNILLTLEGAHVGGGARRRRIARLLDFGLARRPDGGAEDEVSGSPHYLAPERAAGGPPSVRADVYALGVLGYHLLTGTLPFSGDVVELLMAHINQAPEPPSRRRGEPIDDALESLVLRAMAKDPAQRPPSAAAFRNELDVVMERLDLRRRRRPSGTLRPLAQREVTIAAAFEQSRIAQALVSFDGRIELANPAFGELLGEDLGVDGLHVAETALARDVPDLVPALRRVHAEGAPLELRARVDRGDARPALALTLWLCPLPAPAADVHLLVRAEEAPPRGPRAHGS